MNLKYYWWVFPKAISEDFCDKIIEDHKKDNIEKYKYLAGWNENSCLSVYKSYSEAYKYMITNSTSINDKMSQYLKDDNPEMYKHILKLNDKLPKIEKDIDDIYYNNDNLEINTESKLDSRKLYNIKV